MPPTTSTQRTRATRSSSPLSVHSHLTGRDRHLLTMLADHRVLTTDQIQRLCFTSLRTCQLRLAALRRLGVLDRFRWARDGGGSHPWAWVLGWQGARLQAAAEGRPAPTERAHRDQVLRLSMRPDLGHLLLTNEFFVQLHHAARSRTGTGSGTATGFEAGPAAGARLLRWWPEHVAAARFPGIHPDGHGIWTTGGDAGLADADDGGDDRGDGGGVRARQAVGFFLECDTGTEPLMRLAAKLDAYARQTATGPRYPVLFWLPGRKREDNLRRLLHRDADLAVLRTITVVTATHDDHPAGPVWLPVTGRRRLFLADLPSNHGPRSATNPNWRHGVLDLSDQRASG